MFSGNYRLAADSIKQAKLRSFLTMLGIIIGIASVVTTVSLGEGLKKRIEGQINHLGSDLITVRPGNVVRRDGAGNVVSFNFAGTGVGTGSVSEADYKAIQRTPHVRTAVPFSVITAAPEVSGRVYEKSTVLGTTAGAPDILNRRVEFGNFFGGEDEHRYAAVIGRRVAEDLFQEYAPIGKTIRIRNFDFTIWGVFEEFDDNSFLTGVDYNSAIFVPFPIGKQISDNQVDIMQILARPDDPANLDSVTAALNKELSTNHSGQKDFTVLKQSENLSAIGYILNIITGFIAAIAAISLFVGGIGIMNIMLFTVSERTWEIGIRKSVGATNRQIRNQFMSEAILLSFLGGIFGIAISLGINAALRVLTTFEPVVTWPIIAVASGVSIFVGIIFGTFPAVRAAKLDPIEALRRV